MNAAPKPRRTKAWLECAALCALLVVFTCMVVGESRHSSATVDEFHLVPQAIALRATGDLELGYKTPPLLKRWIGIVLSPGGVKLPDHRSDGRAAADGWKPWIFGTRFMVANPEEYDRIFRRARLTMLPLAWALALVIWAWARSAAGRLAGLLALVFFSFSPELISFSSLVSLDLAVTALVVGFVALLRLHARGGSWWTLGAAGLLFGLGLSVKLSVVCLTPLFLAAWFGPGVTKKNRIFRAGGVALAAAAALFALQASYGFDHPVFKWSAFRPASAAFRKLDTVVPAGMPIPVPLLWMRAIDGQARDVQSADVLSYLDGEWSEKGWRRYYLAAWVYKSPLPLLGLVTLLAVGSVWQFTRRHGLANPSVETATIGAGRLFEGAFVLAPIAIWGGAFSQARGLDIGIRYVLPCYALACVGLGIWSAKLLARPVAGALAAALVIAYAAASIAAYPHHLSYMNRLGGGNEGAWRHLADSNVDWGQELKHLAAYLREHEIDRVGLGYFGHVAPELYGIDYFIPEGDPDPGWYAVSANFVAGYSYLAYDHGQLRMTRSDQFAAFRTRKPVATLGGALLLYRID